MTITVHWDTARKSIRQDVITVTAPADVTDRDLANAAGLSARHFGYTVSRHDDGSATVCLHND